MAASDADVVEVIEANAELRLDERIGGGIHFTSHAEGLEAIDAGCGELDVVAPASDHRITLDCSAGDAGSGEGSTLE